MANLRGRTSRAAALHRRAAATATAAAELLDDTRPAPADQRRQYELADRLRRVAEVLAPGWAGAAVESLTLEVPSADTVPAFVRVGTAAPLDDARYPALVPLFGTGHLTIDADAGDPQVAGLLRALLLRLFAASPAGALLVRAVDGSRPVPAASPGAAVERTGGPPVDAAPTGVAAPPGGTFAPFAALADAGLLPPPATDLPGLRTVLAEAEQWVASGTVRQRRHDRAMLLVIAGLPESTGPHEVARIGALADSGPGCGLHLVVAGWPNPAAPLTPTGVAASARPGAAAGSHPGPGTLPTPTQRTPTTAPPTTGARSAGRVRAGHGSDTVQVAAGTGVRPGSAATVAGERPRTGPAVTPVPGTVSDHRAGVGLTGGSGATAASDPTGTTVVDRATTSAVPPGYEGDDVPTGVPATLPYTTTISVRNGYALVGDPPGTSFSAPGGAPPGGLNSPVLVEEEPPADLVEAVCRRLARRVAAGVHLTLSTLLPDDDEPSWTASSADGLATVVGDADGRAVTLGLTELTPHWLVSGRPGSGRADFLTNVLFGLAARYGPDELVLHLVDLADSESFAEFLQTRRDRSWVPQVRTAALAADREYVQELFGHLEAEVRRREEAARRAGGQRFAELRQHQSLPRIVCVIDNVPLLFRNDRNNRNNRNDPNGPNGWTDRSSLIDRSDREDRLNPADRVGGRPPQRDRIGVDLATRLEALARAGRTYGIHLILGGEGDLGLGPGSTGRDTPVGRDGAAGREGPAGRDGAAGRESVLGQFPVRVALPGGGAVLEPTNDAAAGLAVGSAVINTAGGLGGPRGAIRGHERMVRFPDPLDDPTALAGLRHRLWTARPEGSSPPVVFAGYARPSLRNDPCYRAAVAGSARTPAALLGRAVDVFRTTAAVPLGPATGANLVVLGTGPEAAGLLVTAARSVAAHHRPGTARFVVAALTGGASEIAASLAAELADQHPVESVDLTGLLATLTDDRPGYLVVFGADGPGGVPDEPLRTLLRDGPPAGRHLLGWWRSVSSLGALLDPEDGVGKLATVVVVDVPGGQLAPVLGRGVHWSPRPGRALLCDSPDGPGIVLVPFAEDGTAAGR